jgi:hypothetical protein
MSVLIPFLTFGLLAVVSYQDFRYRALSSIVLAGLSALTLVHSILINSWEEALLFAGINLLLIVIQLLGIMAYFSLKHKRITNIINTYLGSGDLWFYAVLACSFSPMNFVVFNLAACLVILVVYAFVDTKRRETTIPFAGCLALALMTVVLASQVFHVVKPYDDWSLASRLFGRI